LPLARRGLLDAADLRRRADEAMPGYVGNFGGKNSLRLDFSVDTRCPPHYPATHTSSAPLLRFGDAARHSSTENDKPVWE
jgi:hypothetical protein